MTSWGQTEAVLLENLIHYYTETDIYGGNLKPIYRKLLLSTLLVINHLFVKSITVLLVMYNI